MKEQIQTPETEILDFLNQITGSKFRPIKSNLTKISTLFKSGFNQEQIREVIQLKFIQWNQNPKMAGYLCPGTLFRESNFEKYVNEVEKVKQNPQLYAQHFAEINRIKSTGDPSGAFSKIDEMFGRK